MGMRWRRPTPGTTANPDLERWVTYHLIEPLWAELMGEHEAPAPAAVRGGLRAPEAGNSGRLSDGCSHPQTGSGGTI